MVVADINEELAAQTAAQIVDAGNRAQPYAIDVTDAAAVKKMIDDTVARHGKIDYLFNNAGIAIFGEVRDMAVDQWQRIIDVNLRGVLHGVLAAYPLMIAQGFGHIVNTSSLAGLTPTPIATSYSMTKHALVGLSLSLRGEAAALGVRVSVVCPGFIDTAMKNTLTYQGLNKEKMLEEMPLRLHSADGCARVILRGVARNRPIITVTALAKIMWWLYRLAPSLTLWLGKLSMKEFRGKYMTEKTEGV